MTIMCPTCKREVKLISFGNGLIGLCCDKIHYNKSDKSVFYTKQIEKEAANNAIVPKHFDFSSKNS